LQKAQYELFSPLDGKGGVRGLNWKKQPE